MEESFSSFVEWQPFVSVNLRDKLLHETLLMPWLGWLRLILVWLRLILCTAEATKASKIIGIKVMFKFYIERKLKPRECYNNHYVLLWQLCHQVNFKKEVSWGKTKKFGAKIYIFCIKMLDQTLSWKVWIVYQKSCENQSIIWYDIVISIIYNSSSYTNSFRYNWLAIHLIIW